MLKNLINKIHFANCIDILNQLDDNSIDICTTDPPYRLTGGGGNPAINGHFKKNGIKTENGMNGKLFKHNDILFNEWIPAVYRVLKNTSHFYCMCNAKNLQTLLNAGTDANFIIQTVLVWKKFMHTPSQYYMPNIEFIVLFRKGNAKYINNMGTKALIEIKGIQNKIHPSQKPVELFELFINNSSKENDIVLDPFLGYGTTVFACNNTNRNYIACEIDIEYYNLAKNNIQNKIDIEKFGYAKTTLNKKNNLFTEL